MKQCIIKEIKNIVTSEIISLLPIFGIIQHIFRFVYTFLKICDKISKKQ